MREISRVHRLEALLLTPVKPSSELNSGAAAAPKVQDILAATDDGAASLATTSSSQASGLLLVALPSTTLDLTRISSVGAGVLLNGARALDGGAGLEEGVSVDGEGAVGSRVGDDGGGRAAEGAGEGLDVHSAGGDLLHGGFLNDGWLLIFNDRLADLLLVNGWLLDSRGLLDSRLVINNRLADLLIANSGEDVGLRNSRHQKVLGNDAPDRIVLVVAGVTSSSRVANLTRGKGAALQSKKRVSPDGEQSLGDLELDLGVVGRLGRSRVLVLVDVDELGIDRSLVAEGGSLADGQGVTLEGTEEDGVDGQVEVVGGLGVGESLVGDDLLEAVEAVGRDVTGAVGGSGVAEEGEHAVEDVVWVVELEGDVAGAEDGLVRVFLGNLALGGSEGVSGHIAGRGEANGDGHKSSSVLHGDGWLFVVVVVMSTHKKGLIYTVEREGRPGLRK